MVIIEKKIQSISFLNILLALYPLAYILGNLAINLLSAIIIIFSLFIFKGKIIPSVNKNLTIVLICFFSYLILITLFSYLFAEKEPENFLNNFWKSILYLRYLFLFFIVSLMIEKGFLNLKYFFISAASLSFVLGVDLIVQYNLGVDLFGFEQPEHLKNRRHSGFFGDELIAGGYLYRFSFFAIFFFCFIKLITRKQIYLFFFITFIFFLITIFISGNRMPLVLFIFSIFIFSIIEKKLRYVSIPIIVLLICFSALIVKTEFKILPGGFKNSISSFYNKSSEIILRSKDIVTNNPIYQHEMIYEDEKKTEFQEATKNKIEFKSGHLKIFNAAIETWKQNKLFGGGLRSFRINCDFKFNVYCAQHSHNYFTEILINTGVIGLILFLSIGLLSLKNFFNFYFSQNLILIQRCVLIPFFLVIISEFMPFRSAGNFFSTFNSTIFFIYLALVANANSANFINKFKL